jgi:hypothetical protein
MEAFLSVLRALLDADIQVQSAHYNSAVLLGSHNIELVVDDSADVERVIHEVRKLGLNPVVPPKVAAPQLAITIAIDERSPVEPGG